MNRVESVFIDADRIVPEANSFWHSIDGEIKKLKIGEVFQLEDKTLSLSCIRCFQTFQYFTEFSLHIQEHYLQGDIVNLKEIKEEPTENIEEEIPSLVESAENLPILQISSLHSSMDDDVNSNYSVKASLDDDDFHSEAFPDEFDENVQQTADFDANQAGDIKSLEQPKTVEFVEGEHYVKADRKFQCLINSCDRVIERWDHLKEHLHTHVAEKDVCCPVCSKAFSSVPYVRKHCLKVHKQKISSTKIKAAQSLPSGGGATMVKIKMRSHRSETQSSLEQLTDTTNRFVNNEQFECLEKCGKRFKMPRYVQKHMRCVHGLKVDIQSIMETQQKSLNDSGHREGDGQMNAMVESMMLAAPVIKVETTTVNETEYFFECFECHKQFSRMQSLKKHLNLHSGIKYKCPVITCNRIFAQRTYVMDHLVTIHGYKKTSSVRTKIQATFDYFVSESRNITSFECYLCKKEYRTKVRLSVHMKNHLFGPYLCGQCGLIFKSRDTLRHHMERHRANAPVQCPQCDRTYLTRRYMLRHLRTLHAADKETKQMAVKKENKAKSEPKQMVDCSQCDKRFSTDSR